MSSKEDSKIRYSDSRLVRVGDIIRMGDATGTVVCGIESGICDLPRDFKDWAYLERGILADFETLGLIHLENVEADIELVGRPD